MFKIKNQNNICFKRLAIILLILICQFQTKLYSQKNNTNKKEIEEFYLKLYNKASKDFFNLNNKESVKQIEKVLEYSLKNKNHKLSAKAYGILGYNFQQYSDFKRAIEYFEKGVVFASKINDNALLGWLYNNIGCVYSYYDINLEKGNFYFKKAFEQTKNINDCDEYLISGLNIGSNLIELGEYEEGKKYLDKIKIKLKPVEEIDILVPFYAAYATYYDKYKKDFKKAEISFLKAIKFGVKDTFVTGKLNLLELYKSTAYLYDKYNKPQKAVQYFKLILDLDNKIKKTENKNITTNKNNDFRLDLINYKIEKVEKENKNYEKKLNNNRYFIIFLSVLVFAFIALLYYLFKNYSKNKKINKKLKRANIELHNAKRKTEEISKLKAQFMSTVSHELRTPLYGVIGMTEIIETEHEELKNSKYLNSLKFSAKYLLSLINDVLNLSKIESEEVKLVFEDVNLDQELVVIKNSMEVIANQYNNEIIVEIDANVPKFIETDKTRLSQIIINLISNALKFTKDGTVKVAVSVNNKNETLNFAIKDTGIGIPKKYLEKVFEKFMQVERNSDEQFQGTGLGLAIVKRFVDLFKGDIAIESEVNFGTKIVFSIPLKIGNEIKDIETNSTSLLIENISVLVVEDNKINQIVTQKLLEKNKLKCKIAVDGYEALEILKEEKFDIILMDIHMPGINGFETTEKIHELGITTPIIALTASDRYEIDGDISKYKMSDLLVKPFEFIDLQNLLIKFIKK